MQDILCHVHSLLPLRDAARAACVSHVFLNSWRCRPNLYFNTEALGLEANCGRTSRDFTKIVDHILKKYSDIGLKTFQLAMYGCYYIESCHLDSWLHLALTLGIEELILATNSMVPKYNFPLSLLSGKSGNSIRYLRLSFCIFRPTVRLGCFKSLKKLHLYCVGISGDELGYLLPVSVALEQLELAYCNEIICLKIPHVLQRLSCLDVAACHNLQMIKSEAPNLSSLCFEWFHHHVHTSLGEALHVKKLQMLCFRDFYYVQLPTIMPNLEALTIDSICQIASIPSVHSKFCSLKYLNICVPGEVRGPVYDYLSLASFLGASPCLETFILRIHVPEVRVKYGLFSGDPSHPRQMPEHRYVKLKRAKIIGFYPAKSLLELASHVLETATSLECLTLDTTYCSCGRRHSDPAKCYLVAIKRYFEGKVPSTARLDVEGPCSGALQTCRLSLVTAL
uniref:At1g61320/AtMIF1 LRR domain-containing protein n=1 Tax=Setaria italica TaxID=4555 RepID=K4A0R6_SETIT